MIVRETPLNLDSLLIKKKRKTIIDYGREQMNEPQSKSVQSADKEFDNIKLQFIPFAETNNLISDDSGTWAARG